MLQAAYPAICKQDMSMRKTVIPLVAFSLLAGCATSTIKGSADSHPPKQSPAQEAARTTLNQGIALYEQQQYAAALPLIEQAVAASDIKASRYLGLMAFYGRGLPQDAAQAFVHFEKGAQAGDITAQYWLGYLYEHGIGTAPNLGEALRWYQHAAERGDKIAAPAMWALARFYRNGIAVAHNTALADEYAQKAQPLLQANEGNFLSTYPTEKY